MKATGTIFLTILLVSLVTSPTLAEHCPSKSIELVIPFKAGGGTDTLGRIFQKAVENELPYPLAVVNVPGAAGVLGARKVKNAKPEGYTMLLSQATLLMATAQGTANFGPEAFEAVAGTTTSNMAVCVAKHNPYKTLKELLEAGKANPNQIHVVTNIGAIVHFAWLKFVDHRHP